MCMENRLAIGTTGKYRSICECEQQRWRVLKGVSVPSIKSWNTVTAIECIGAARAHKNHIFISQLAAFETPGVVSDIRIQHLTLRRLRALKDLLLRLPERLRAHADREREREQLLKALPLRICISLRAKFRSE